MFTIPEELIIENQPCLVVGGSKAAVRAVEKLAQAGANVTLAAPKLPNTLSQQSAQGRMQHYAGCFNPELLNDQSLVVTATGNPLSNYWVAEHAARRNIPVSVLE